MKIEGRKLMREITLGCGFGRENPIGKRPTGDLIAYGRRLIISLRLELGSKDTDQSDERIYIFFNIPNIPRSKE